MTTFWLFQFFAFTSTWHLIYIPALLLLFRGTFVVPVAKFIGGAVVVFSENEHEYALLSRILQAPHQRGPQVQAVRSVIKTRRLTPF